MVKDINMVKATELDDFLDAAKKFNEEFKEEIEKEKEEYLKKQGIYN